MHALDPAAYLRLDAPHSLGATAAGASFATSTGDILEVDVLTAPACSACASVPTRGPTTASSSAARRPAPSRNGAGRVDVRRRRRDARDQRHAAALPAAVEGRAGARVDHRRALPRLDAAADVRSRCAQGGLWTAAFALASGEPVYGLGEKFGPLDKRGQLIHSQVEDALGVNTGLAYKNTPFAWSPGTGKGAWGMFVHTPGMVTHGVGHPDWSHRSYAVVVDDEALDLFLFAADTPAGDPRSLHAADRARAAPVPRWSLGLWVSRAYYKTPEEAIAVARKLRERRFRATC